MAQTLLRIGAGAGYAGDRIPPALALAEKGQLDYLVFECLAERTIALAKLEKIQNPLRGFDPFGAHGSGIACLHGARHSHHYQHGRRQSFAGWA